MFGHDAADTAALAVRLAAYAGSLDAERALLVLLDQPLLWAAPELRRRLAEQAAPHSESSSAAEPSSAAELSSAAEKPSAVEPPTGQARVAAELGGEVAGGLAPSVQVPEQAPASTAGRPAGGGAADGQPGPGICAAARPAARPVGGPAPAIVVAGAAARHLDPGEDAAGAAGSAADASGRMCAAGYTWELPAGVQASHRKHSFTKQMPSNQCAEAGSLFLSRAALMRVLYSDAVSV